MLPINYSLTNPIHIYIIYIYIYIGWNVKIVARRKDDMIPFPFNENRFSFFVADHLLVGQLCTNPKEQ